MNELYRKLFFDSIIYDMSEQFKLKLEKYKPILVTIEFVEAFEDYINENRKIPFIDRNVSDNIYILLNFIRDNAEDMPDKTYLYDIINDIIVYLNGNKESSTDYYFNQTALRNIDPCFIYGDAKFYTRQYRQLLYKTISQDFSIFMDLKKDPASYKIVFENKYKMNNPRSLEAQVQYPNQFFLIYTVRIIRYENREILTNQNIRKNLEYTLEQYKKCFGNASKRMLNTTEIELLQAIRTLEKILLPEKTSIEEKKTKQKRKKR